MEEIKLYSARVCPYAHRARLCLHEKGLQFQTIEIDLTDKPDWFGSISPKLAVPALSFGDLVLYESSIILEFLNDRFADPALMPSDAARRSLARLWIYRFNSELIPCFYRLLKESDDEKQQALRRELLTHIEAFDQQLKKTQADGPFWLGRDISLVDISLYPWFERWPVLEHYRNLHLPENLIHVSRWWKAMFQRTSVQRQIHPAGFYIDAYLRYVQTD